MKQNILIKCKTCRFLMKIRIADGKKFSTKQTCLEAPLLISNLKKSQFEGEYPAITDCSHYSA